MPPPLSTLRRTWGFWALLTGGIGLVLVFAQMAIPSFEKAPSVGQQVGEIAGEIRRSAWRSFMGLPSPEPEVVRPSISDYLAIVAPIFGVVALVLAAIAGFLRENWRVAAYGASLGAAAIVFQLLWWVVLLVMGIILLVAIIENIGDIFGG